MLRGPYVLAYLSVFAVSVMMVPYHPSGIGWWWKGVMALLMLTVLLGTLGSWMVVSTKTGITRWHKVETFELSGLRLAAPIQIVSSLWSVVWSGQAPAIGLTHLAVGFFLLGMLLSLTWHRGRAGRNGA